MQRRPNFLIIGGEKCGTTSLYGALSDHPQVFMPELKEPQFFSLVDSDLPTGPGDRDSPKVTEWSDYLSLFAPARDELAIGEATPVYLHVARAAVSIQRYLGTDVKLIASLRNPIERAYSAYLHKRRIGYEPLDDFEQALAAGPERVRAGWHPAWDYIAFGFYADALQRFTSTFGEANVKVVLLDDLAERPRETLDEIASFLGIEALPVSRAHEKRGGVPRSWGLQRWLMSPPAVVSKVARTILPASVRRRMAEVVGAANLRRAPSITPATRERLAAIYEDDIRNVEGLIGRDLSGWLEPARTGR